MDVKLMPPDIHHAKHITGKEKKKTCKAQTRTSLLPLSTKNGNERQTW